MVEMPRRREPCQVGWCSRQGWLVAPLIIVPNMPPILEFAACRIQEQSSSKQEAVQRRLLWKNGDGCLCQVDITGSILRYSSSGLRGAVPDVVIRFTAVDLGLQLQLL